MVNARYVVAFGLLAFGLSACGGSQQSAPDPDAPTPEQQPAPPVDDEPTAPSPSAVRLLITDAVGETDLSPRDVSQRLGQPERIETEPTQNRHDPSQTDTLRTLVYDGLRVEFYHVSASQKKILQQVTLTGERYRAPQGLRIGTRRDSVQHILGDPIQREEDEFVYEIENGPTPTMLTVQFQDDAATRFRWSFYVD